MSTPCPRQDGRRGWPPLHRGDAHTVQGRIIWADRTGPVRRRTHVAEVPTADLPASTADEMFIEMKWSGTILAVEGFRAVSTRYGKRAYVFHGTVTAAAIRRCLLMIRERNCCHSRPIRCERSTTSGPEGTMTRTSRPPTEAILGVFRNSLPTRATRSYSIPSGRSRTAGTVRSAGPLLWPSDEPWPECSLPDENSPVGAATAMVPVAQIFRALRAGTLVARRHRPLADPLVPQRTLGSSGPAGRHQPGARGRHGVGPLT